MNRRLPVVLPVCCALVFATGCGSSSKSSTAGSSGSATSAAAATGGLKSDTTPKYASPSKSSPVQSGTVQISYHDIAINPDTVRVKAGSTVEWTDEDEVTHNVTSESGPAKFASKDLHYGSTFEIKLTRPGTIHYECTYHPASMNGTIEVVK
jgi:plastocyanin